MLEMRGKTNTMSGDLGVFLAGGKTGVLLLHDVGGTAAELRALAVAFARDGYSVACPQLSGLDDRESEGAGSASKIVVEAEQALARLKKRCESIVAIGAGYGAMLALQIARQSDAVQAVVLHEPRFWLPGLPTYLPKSLTVRASQSLIARAMSASERLRRMPSATSSNVPLGFAHSKARPSGSALRQLGALLDCVHGALPEIRQPVLLVHRQSTVRSGLDGSLDLQRRLGGRVESMMVDDATAAAAQASTDRGAELIADRSIRFIATVLEDIRTRRENEARRQRIAAGRSSAA